MGGGEGTGHRAQGRGGYEMQRVDKSGGHASHRFIMIIDQQSVCARDVPALLDHRYSTCCIALAAAYIYIYIS